MVPGERRRSKRLPAGFPVAVLSAESPGLHGQAIDMSREGVFLSAWGHLTLVLGINGKTYRGRLVRLLPDEDGMPGYAVELEERMDMHPAAVPVGTQVAVRKRGRT